MRNSEVRALRYCDFTFDVTPSVRICGMASGSHREERIKSDSKAGFRTIGANKYVIAAYEKASKISCSNTYLFTRQKNYINGDEILVTEQAVRRALRKTCRELGLQYYNVHRLRFSVATILAEAGTNVYELQEFLGHTGPTMSLKYVQMAQNKKVNNAWTKLDQVI